MTQPSLPSALAAMGIELPERPESAVRRMYDSPRIIEAVSHIDAQESALRDLLAKYAEADEVLSRAHVRCAEAEDEASELRCKLPAAARVPATDAKECETCHGNGEISPEGPFIECATCSGTGVAP